MTEEENKTNKIYQGGYSSLDPEKNYVGNFLGMHIPSGDFALTTDPRNANFLQEVSSKLSTGVKNIEVEGISPDIFESVPQQHLKEINRLAKLTGINVTLHGPLIEASGFTKEGWSESNRQSAERQMIQAIERAHEINPEGSSPVTFHSSVILPGQIKPKGKEEVEEILVINPQKGSINRIPIKERHFPEEGKINVKKEIQKINEEVWDQQLRNLAYYSDMGIDAIEKSKYLELGAMEEEKEGLEISPEFQRGRSTFNRGVTFLNDSYREFKDLYEIAYSSSNPEQKKVLNKLGEEITKNVQKINENPRSKQSIVLRKEIIDKGIETLNNFIEVPEIYRPLEDFAREKSIDTFASGALNSYKKFKDKAPIISIENPPAGAAFSTGEELKKLVEESRKKFVEFAKKDGISESVAKAQAEKLIGVTWDVGHINMLRKYGYEAKDIVKESEKIKPLLKHIHLSDNFGFEHTELPMGMGNVPMKEIMKKLGKEGFEAKKVIEAGNWWQHFKTPPVQESLEAFGSPIYSMKMAPYWNQSIGLYQGYFGGVGPVFPQGNYNTFGAGFSQLPMELGGQIPGQQGSKLSGNKME